MKTPRNKYGVAPREARTFKGLVFASKAEAIRAAELDLLRRNGDVTEVIYQPLYLLGPDFTYRADFEVRWKGGRITTEDVKGVETRDFARTKRLWKKYGPRPLYILRRRGAGWAHDAVHPDAQPA